MSDALLAQQTAVLSNVLTDEIELDCRLARRFCTSAICSAVRPKRLTALIGAGVSTDSRRSRSALISGCGSASGAAGAGGM